MSERNQCGVERSKYAYDKRIRVTQSVHCATVHFQKQRIRARYEMFFYDFGFETIRVAYNSDMDIIKPKKRVSTFFLKKKKKLNLPAHFGHDLKLGRLALQRERSLDFSSGRCLITK